MALYKSTYMTPNNVTIDATINNVFSCVIKGTICSAYNLIILNNTSNVEVYSSGIVDISSTPLYNNETLSVTVLSTSGMTNAIDSNYKWYLLLYETYTGSEDYTIKSNEVFFKARTTPTITFDPTVPATVSTRAYEFNGVYSGDASTSSIKYYEFILYDSDEVEIDRKKEYSANIVYEYDTFLSSLDILNPTEYKIELTAESQDGQFITTGIIDFDVYYAIETAILGIETSLNEDSSILIDWNVFVTIVGEYIDIDPTFIEDTPFVDTNSVDLSQGGIYYDNKNEKDLSLDISSTMFLHNNFDEIDIKTNVVNGINDALSSISIAGVLATITVLGEDTSGIEQNLLKVLSYENGHFSLWTKNIDNNVITLDETYTTYSNGDFFVLGASGSYDEDNYYGWDDTAVWDDTSVWLDNDSISDIWWILTWMNLDDTTQGLIIKRDTNV